MLQLSLRFTTEVRRWKAEKNWRLVLALRLTDLVTMVYPSIWELIQ